jgi:hypothetical protein
VRIEKALDHAADGLSALFAAAVLVVLLALSPLLFPLFCVGWLVNRLAKDNG